MSGEAVPWWRTRWRGNREQGRLEGVGKWPESGGSRKEEELEKEQETVIAPLPGFIDPWWIRIVLKS